MAGLIFLVVVVLGLCSLEGKAHSQEVHYEK